MSFQLSSFQYCTSNPRLPRSRSLARVYFFHLSKYKKNPRYPLQANKNPLGGGSDTFEFKKINNQNVSVCLGKGLKTRAREIRISFFYGPMLNGILLIE